MSLTPPAAQPEFDHARYLLIRSYSQSAERVMAALHDHFNIANSREPGNPPAHRSEVVGLCGQGGRHPYFRMQASDLDNAASEILRLRHRHEPVEAILDELVNVCQRLRRRTRFDGSTGCVNDTLPAIVPLLPPEEIWLDGRELPLDVWRLLSCETDLVSSSLAAHVPLGDVAFGSLTQSGMAFRLLMSRMQALQLRIDVSLRKPPLSVAGALGPPRRMVPISLARLFFETGCLLTPFNPSAVAQWYAALRYQDWIASTAPRLSVRDELRRDSVDSRYRGLFAEEMAVGMMAIGLADLFRATSIVNTVEYLAAHYPARLKQKGAIADFVAMAPHPVSGHDITIIAESKGSLGAPVNKERTRHAKQQVSATRARIGAAPAGLALAFCSSLFFSLQGKEAACEVIDPPAEPGDADLVLTPHLVWRMAYGKALRFVGLDGASRQIERGEPATALSPMYDRERSQEESDGRRRQRAAMAREAFGAELLLDVGPCAVGIDPQIMGLLRESGISEGTDELLSKFTAARRRDTEGRETQSFLSRLGLGCIFYDELDQLARG